MRLTDTINKIKVSAPYWLDIRKDLFITGLILLTAVGSFMLGRLSFLAEKGKNELKITRTESLPAVALSDQGDSGRGISGVGGIRAGRSISSSSKEVLPRSGVGMYVGSRSGTTYYLPWCGGVKRIHEENKIWFKDKADAISKGYKPASTCKGI